MNNHQLEKLGVPRSCYKYAIQGIQKLAKVDYALMKSVKTVISNVVNNPAEFVEDKYFGDMARSLIEDKNFVATGPIPFKIWGKELIEPNTLEQMSQACSIPVAKKAAIMPDGHVAYSAPVGSVIGLDNAISPEFVGPDISCQVKFSFLDIKPIEFQKKHKAFCDAVNKGTSFGVGCERVTRCDHSVFDQDWNVTKVTRENKDKAFKQLGTSGSSNHFVDLGIVELFEDNKELGLSAGQYVGIMSHSGSRGTGASIYDTYRRIASSEMPERYKAQHYTPWLDLNTQVGQEYWAAMSLAGDYASANHDVIHKTLSKLTGAKIIADVESRHNFAFKEVYDGKELIVHRKGATPVGLNVLGIVPSSMATPAYIVRGLGNDESLNSCSHGTGRQLSRTQAKNKYNFKSVKMDLAKKGITVLSAGADESPGAYKNIDEVMEFQKDLVQPIARFQPMIVKMADDSSGED